MWYHKKQASPQSPGLWAETLCKQEWKLDLSTLLIPKPEGNLEESTDRMLKSTGADNNLYSPKDNNLYSPVLSKHMHVKYYTISLAGLIKQIIKGSCQTF